LAKKRRQKVEKKEDYVFTPPEVDRNEFIRDELRNAKATFISFGFAILMGLVSYGLLMAIGDFRVGGIIGIFAVGALPFIYNYMKLDISGFDWKNWAGVVAVYIFSWLMIAVLLVNPPITDMASPEVKEISFEVYEENVVDNETVYKWVSIEKNTDGDIVVPHNTTFRILVTVIDNNELDENSVMLKFEDTGGSYSREKIDDHRYSFEFGFGSPFDETGDFNFEISAKDTNGNEKVKSGSFTIV
jgi:hypothetical protein